MSKTSCIALPPNDFFTVTRNCYLQICKQNDKSDECAAKLLDMLVNFHDYRLAMGYFDPKKPIYQHHTQKELSVRLLGTFKEKKIGESVRLLVEKGFIKIHENPNPRYKGDRTYHYEVIPSVIQKALESLAQSQAVNSQDGAVNSQDGAVNSQSHYKDPYQDLNEDRIPSINTHSLTAEPEKSADASGAIEPPKILEAEFCEEPLTTPIKPTPIKTPPSVNNPVSGKEESSVPCRTPETTSITTTGYIAKTEQRYTHALTTLELAELVQTLIDTYNKSKPSSWGTCTKNSAHLIKQVRGMVRVYCEDMDLSAAVENIKNDVGSAFLSLRDDKYYDNSIFGNKTIGFFLNEKAVDRMRTRAQVWYDKPQAAKETAAKAIVNEIINGVPDWDTGEILSDRQYRSYARRYRKNLSYPAEHEIWTVMPSPEYLHKHFPQIFEEESC